MIHAARLPLAARIRLGLLSLAVLCPLVSSGAPAEAGLQPGDLAPPLRVSAWLRGEQVHEFGADHVYLVTWWSPARAEQAAFRALAQLQRGCEQLIVVGMCSEDPLTSYEQVQRTLLDWADTEGVRFAWDDGTRSRGRFLGSDAAPSAEHSILIDRAGRVAWIGPAGQMAEPLPDVLAGTWNAESGGMRMRRFQEQSRRAQALERDQPGAALVLLDELARAYPRLDELLLVRRYALAHRLCDGARIEGFGRRIVETAYAHGDAAKLIYFARHLVDPEIEHPDRFLHLARTAAEHAIQLTAGEAAEPLACLARVHAWQADYSRAIECQVRAVDLSDEQDRARHGSVLSEYRAAHASSLR